MNTPYRRQHTVVLNNFFPSVCAAHAASGLLNAVSTIDISHVIPQLHHLWPSVAL